MLRCTFAEGDQVQAPSDGTRNRHQNPVSRPSVTNAVDIPDGHRPAVAVILNPFQRDLFIEKSRVRTESGLASSFHTTEVPHENDMKPMRCPFGQKALG